VNAPASEPSARIRLTVIVAIVGVLFATLVARLWFLQVVNAPTAQAAVQTNGVKTILIPAPRGDILTADGKVLAGNRITQVITVQRQAAAGDPAMVSRLAALLGMTVGQLHTAINNLEVSPYAPVPVRTDATDQQILYVKENPQLFPGVSATQEQVREYTPLGVMSANIVGYTGQINARQYQALKSKGYGPSDQIGELGVEAAFESVLRGRPGVEKVEVDAQGNVLGMVSYTPPVAGDNVVLTINSVDQQVAVRTLEAEAAAVRQTKDSAGLPYRATGGSVVVENPNNGDVLAMATAPDYNNNAFVGGISQSVYAQYTNPANNFPMENRPIQAAYQPGSTYKLISASAGLQEGLITPGYIFDDTQGGLQVGNHFFKNDGGAAYGPVDVSKALIVSDDAFFYRIGYQFFVQSNKYGPDGLQNWAKAYGFGKPTGIDLPGEVAGLVPDAAVVKKEHEQYPKAYPNGTWYGGDAAQTAIGQEQDLVTPIQLVNAYSTFGNGGTRYVPQIALRIQNAAGQVVTTYQPKVAAHVTLAPANRAAILAGFEGVTSNPQGTAYASFGGTPGLNVLVAGKTGTAQVVNSNIPETSPVYKQPTSVFASFAPAQAPQYAVDCMMEQSGYGASACAPVVRQVYNTLFKAHSATVNARPAGHD
jgi:penicillin-binding protein 2